MSTSAALDACNTQQKSTSDADSAEQGLAMPQQLLIAAPSSTSSQGHAVASLPAASAFRRDGPRMQCQVEDCEIDLRTTKPYCIKKRLCPDHLTAQAVRRRGTTHGFWRFCQQCGKLEPLESFDGAKRSCRARLQKRRAHNWQSYKRTRQMAYKDKMLTRVREVSSADPAEEGDTDNEEDEYQQAMNDEDPMAMSGIDYGGYDNYGADGDAANAAAGLSALAAELQQQQLYQTLLCNAAVLAAAAAPSSDNPMPYTQQGNGQMYGTDVVDAAAAAAVVGGGWQHDLHNSSNVQKAQAGSSKHWPSEEPDTDTPRQQQMGVETASPASVAATLAAMAAGARQGSLGQGGKSEQLADSQTPQLDALAGAAAAAASGADYIGPMASRTLSEQLTDRVAGDPKLQQQRQEARQTGAFDKQQLAAYHYHQQQQQQHEDTYQYVAGQHMELDAAAAAAMPVPIRPKATNEDTGVVQKHTSAAAAAAALPAAADQCPAADAAVNHSELQHLLEKLIGSMGPHTDATAALAAMRSLSQAAAAAAVAAAVAEQDSPKEQQQQRPAVCTSLTPSGSTTLADDDMGVAAHFLQQQQQQNQQKPQQASHVAPLRPGTHVTADDVTTQLAALFNLSAKHAAAVQQNRVEAKGLPPPPAAAAAQPSAAAAPQPSMQPPEDAFTSLTAAPGATAGVNAGGGLGLLLSAVVNGLLGDQRQQAPTDDGVQLLGKLLAQSPTAAAALMLSQQQQLQQLHTQQQQLLQQVARLEQQLERTENSKAAEEKQLYQKRVADADAAVAADAAVTNHQSNGHAARSSVTADFAEIIQTQLQAVSKQIMDSLSPLQNQIHQVQAELHMMKGEGS